MITATQARSGKSHRDENFPVASRLIRARHRGPILAFYGFVRAADDVADHPALTPDEKLALLDRLDDALTGAGRPIPRPSPCAARSPSAGCRRATRSIFSKPFASTPARRATRTGPT